MLSLSSLINVWKFSDFIDLLNVWLLFLHFNHYYLYVCCFGFQLLFSC